MAIRENDMNDKAIRENNMTDNVKQSILNGDSHD